VFEKKEGDKQEEFWIETRRLPKFERLPILRAGE
jgi:hypothetical protein